MAVSIKKEKSSLDKKKSRHKSHTEVYREVMIPSQKKVTITLPETLIGKTVEVFAFEVRPKDMPEPTKTKTISKKDFWETFGSGKNSLITAESIREKAWRKYQW